MLWVISRQKIRSPNCVSFASDTDRIADIARGRFCDVRFTPESGHPTKALIYRFKERWIVVRRS